MIESLIEYFADVFTIQTWRSLWYFLDKYLFPADEKLSAYISLASGLIIYLAFYVFNEKLNTLLFSISKKSYKLNSPKCSNKIYRQMSVNNSLFNYHNNDYLINMSISSDQVECYKFNFTAKVILYIAIFWSFVSIVSIWRGLWMLQLVYCYPLLFGSSLLNQNVLNIIYMIVSLAILWRLHLTSTLLSRSNCEDNYYVEKENYFLKKDNFKDLFLKKVNFAYFNFLGF